MLSFANMRTVPSPAGINKLADVLVDEGISVGNAYWFHLVFCIFFATNQASLYSKKT